MRQPPPPRPPGRPTGRPSTAGQPPAPPAPEPLAPEALVPETPAPAPGAPRQSRTGRPSRINAPEDKPIALNISLGDDSASDLEKAEAIRDVMQHAATMSQAVALAREMRSWPFRPILLSVIAIASLSVCIYTFAAQADWAYGPDPARVAPLRHDSGLRFAMFLASQRIEAVRDSAGTLPKSLAELGEAWPGIEYRATDSTYALRARGANGEPIILQPGTDLKTFLADSRRQLRER